MKGFTPRWRFQVLSPVNQKVLWEMDAWKQDDVVAKWKKDTGNSYLSKGKVVRACNGTLNCAIIKCYKLDDFAKRHKKVLEDFVVKEILSPTFSVADDYSTCGESSESENEDSGEETETEETKD